MHNLNNKAAVHPIHVVGDQHLRLTCVHACAPTLLSFACVCVRARVRGTLPSNLRVFSRARVCVLVCVRVCARVCVCVCACTCVCARAQLCLERNLFACACRCVYARTRCVCGV